MNIKFYAHKNPCYLQIMQHNQITYVCLNLISWIYTDLAYCVVLRIMNVIHVLINNKIRGLNE